MAKNSEAGDGKQIDQFDRLPDALLLLVFGKILDAKSLIRCLSVSKRFASFVPQIDTVFLSVPRRNPDFKQYGCSGDFFKFLFRRFVSKPLRFIGQMIARRPTSVMEFENWYYSPVKALKRMKGIENLHMQLPTRGGLIGLNDRHDPMIKWKAEFGTTLESCVILGASSVERKSFSSTKSSHSTNQSAEQGEGLESVMGDEDLKVRITWTISCLIAASTRHRLVKKMVAKFPLIRRVVVTDSSKQGKLCANVEQVAEIRESITSEDSSEGARMEGEGAHFPDLTVKMWFVPELELKGSGTIMKGATLAVIRPGGDKVWKENNGDWLGIDFDTDGETEGKIYNQAVRQMVKSKRKYILEFNSF